VLSIEQELDDLQTQKKKAWEARHAVLGVEHEGTVAPIEASTSDEARREPENKDQDSLAEEDQEVAGADTDIERATADRTAEVDTEAVEQPSVKVSPSSDHDGATLEGNAEGSTEAVATFADSNTEHPAEEQLRPSSPSVVRCEGVHGDATTAASDLASLPMTADRETEGWTFTSQPQEDPTYDGQDVVDLTYPVGEKGSEIESDEAGLDDEKRKDNASDVEAISDHESDESGFEVL